VKPRRIAVLKPDFGVTGGYERMLERVEHTLRADRHDVTRITVGVDALPHRVFGLVVPPEVWQQAPEYFRYLASLQAFERIDTRSFELVVTTQPPSFANPHPRQLSLFYHHHRIFYDLEDLYVQAGFTVEPELHRRAARHVRHLDQPSLERVRWFLAGSESVRSRLARFNQIDRVGLFSAGVPTGGDRLPARRGQDGAGAVLCVGRHEFPKRTELFVQAMKHLPGHRGVSVGTGGRMAYVRAVDRRLSRPGADPDALGPEELWCNTGQGAAGVPDRFESNVSFLGRIDDPTLEHLYREAPCVVAPAYEEDYGLTAIEAMRHGTPVVVCTDGGGLRNLVTDEVDGLVTAPTGGAIAAAVARITDEPGLRARLSQGARHRASGITWTRAAEQLRAGLAEVLA